MAGREGGREGGVHGGGLPSPVMTKESSYLVLIKAEAESIHGRFGASSKHFDQVLDTNTLHQVDRLCFKEGLGCRSQKDKQTGTDDWREQVFEGREHFRRRDEIIGLECHQVLRKQFLSLINQRETGQIALCVFISQHV